MLLAAPGNTMDLADLTVGFGANYQQGFNSAETYHAQIATQIPSATRKQSYPWLADLPGIREWLADREVHKLAQHGYSIENKPWESTVEVDRDDLADDQVGVYAPLMANMGFETARFPDQLVFGQLEAGFDSACYDGQYFFDTDHPGYDSTGAETSVSNTGGGSGNAWYLLDTRRPLKPLVYQLRQAFAFGLLEGEDLGAPVPRSKTVKYGVNGRCNVGYGLWQQAYGSKQTLDATSFDAGMTAMMGLCKRSGQPLGVKPNLLVVGPRNRSAALTVVKAVNNANGASNINQGAVDVLVVEWLR